MALRRELAPLPAWATAVASTLIWRPVLRWARTSASKFGGISTTNKSLPWSIYAVGGNAGSAYLSGIKVQRIQFAVFVISGIIVSLAAISITSRMMAASARTLTGLQIDSVAAVTVGGVSIFGGKGTILGVLI